MTQPQPPYDPPASGGSVPLSKGEPDRAQDPFGTGAGAPAWDPQSAGPAQPPYAQPGPGAPGYAAPGYGAPAYGQQPPYPPAAPPGWGPAPYGSPYGGAPETDSKAIVALVCAIASFVVLPLFPAIAALFVARASKRDIDASAGRLGGRGMATAATVIGWVNIVLCVLAVVGIVLLVVTFSSTGTGFSDGVDTTYSS